MDKIIVMFLIACSFAALSTALSVVLWQTRKRALRAESLVDQLLADRGSATVIERDTHTHALEAIAAEVERIGEGQRFLTKALVERTKEPISEARPVFRSVTPH